MTKWHIEVHTVDNKVVYLGKVSAENGWHAMAIAKKIATRKGLSFTGASSASYIAGR